jgi:predicted ATP-grasp superfamily ATP-dependent carboligase
MNEPALAVVLACGVNGLGAVRSLARARIPTLVVTPSATDPVVHSRHARKHVLRNAADPLPEMLRLLRGLDERPAVVLPASDYFVHLLAEHRAALAETCRFAMPDNDLLAVFRDKARETRFVSATGVPLPRTVQELPPAPAELLRTLGLPILLKPRTTEDKLWFGRKNFLATSAEELEAVYRAHGGELRRLLAQECIPGEDPTLWVCDCVFDRRSELVGAFTFRKLSTAPAHMGVTSLGVSERNAELTELVAALGKKLGYIGPADIDFKYDARDGRYKYLEINPRIGMCNYFGTRCGVNTVRDAYLVAAGADVPPRAGRQKEGVVYVNLHDDLYNRHKEGQRLPALVRTYLGLAGREWVGAYFDWDDARPVVLAGWRNLRNWMGSLRGKLRRVLAPRGFLLRKGAREESACR